MEGNLASFVALDKLLVDENWATASGQAQDERPL
jgi:hypothetical protein